MQKQQRTVHFLFYEEGGDFWKGVRGEGFFSAARKLVARKLVVPLDWTNEEPTFCYSGCSRKII
jgi:hypothetical protein